MRRTESPPNSTLCPLSFGLYTDLYELTMGQTYFEEGMADAPACFDYFFRTNPFGGGYVVFAGLADLLKILAAFRFGQKELEYLEVIGFRPRFLSWLENFRFRGEVFSVREGEVVFPLEPIVRVEGGLFETQIVETLVLNILNFESLVATKAARIRLAAGDRILSEFGLRRAQGPGGILASRAAVIGGFDSTSNVEAARRYGLKPAGTMAHSFVESQPDEITAFRKYAALNPTNSIFLVDTYDTLRSGIPNAIAVAREMAARGERLFGIRLDSGDLAFLSKKARQMLDDAGFRDVRIVASNLLDEYLVKSLIAQGAPIDIFGVGTRLATGAPDGSLDGIYKLSVADGKPKLKLSETKAKVTLPGRKTIHRFSTEGGVFEADAIALADEASVSLMFHPYEAEKSLALEPFQKEELLAKVMEGGAIVQRTESVAAIARYARERLSRLPAECKRFENPHLYKVGLSEKLMRLRDEIVRQHRQEW